MATHAAAGRANATAGLSVLFAGSTVILAIAGLQVAGVPMIAAMGGARAHGRGDRRGGAHPPACPPGCRRRSHQQPARPASAAVDGRATRGRVGGPATSRTDPCATCWRRLPSSGSSRRRSPPFGSASPTTATSASPTPCARPTTSSRTDSDPASTARCRWCWTSPAPATPAASPRTWSAARRYARHLSVVPAASSPDGDLVVVTALPDTSPQDEATAHLVDDLRQDVLPDLGEAHGGEVMVTGSAALQVDVAAKLQSRMPWFIGAVLLLSLLVLDSRLPLGVGAAEGRCSQPAQHRRGVRRPGRGLPVGMGSASRSACTRRCRSTRWRRC